MQPDVVGDYICNKTELHVGDNYSLRIFCVSFLVML